MVPGFPGFPFCVVDERIPKHVATVSDSLTVVFS